MEREIQGGELGGFQLGQHQLRGDIRGKQPDDRPLAEVEVQTGQIGQALAGVEGETIVGDIADIPAKDEAFQLVMCNDVLEHVPRPALDQAVKELFRVAERYVLITVPLV